MTQTTPPDVSHVRIFVTGLPKTALAEMTSEGEQMTDTTGTGLGEVKTFMTPAEWRDWESWTQERRVLLVELYDKLRVRLAYKLSRPDRQEYIPYTLNEWLALVSEPGLRFTLARVWDMSQAEFDTDRETARQLWRVIAADAHIAALLAENLSLRQAAEADRIRAELAERRAAFLEAAPLAEENERLRQQLAARRGPGLWARVWRAVRGG